jgi:hypothetical protein
LDQDSPATTDEEVQRLILVQASYGYDGEFTDVTDAVKEKIQLAGKVAVQNEELGGDPLRFTIKDLNIIYLSGDERKTITAIEGSVIERKDSQLAIHETPTSERKIHSRNNMLALTSELQGHWILVQAMGRAKGRMFSLDPMVNTLHMGNTGLI